MRLKITAGLFALGTASALLSGGAGADPQTGFTFPLVCDNGQTYDVTSNGNGEFTPAHDIESTTVFVPVAFGPFTGTVRNAQNQVVDSFTDPASAKGQSARGLADPVTCTYSFTEVSDGSDPDFPAGYTFSGVGTAVVRMTPSR